MPAHQNNIPSPLLSSVLLFYHDERGPARTRSGSGMTLTRQQYDLVAQAATHLAEASQLFLEASVEVNLQTIDLTHTLARATHSLEHFVRHARVAAAPEEELPPVDPTQGGPIVSAA